MNTSKSRRNGAIKRTSNKGKGRELALREYAVRRTYQGVIATTPTDTGRAASVIALSNVPDVAEFTNLFDQFTIDSVDVKFVCNRAAISAGNSAIFPTLLYAPDYNDSVAPGTVNDILSYGNLDVFQFSETARSVKYTLRPKAAVSVSSGTAISPGRLWCSTSSASATPWYGFKYWLVDYNSTSSTGSVVTLYLTFHLSFRAPK